MAVLPSIYNISLQRRADYYVTLHFKDPTGAVTNLKSRDWTITLNGVAQ